MFEELVTPSGVFWCYGSVALFGALFVYFIVPETRGKSLDEIEHLFDPEKSNHKQHDETWPHAQQEGQPQTCWNGDHSCTHVHYIYEIEYIND